MLPLSRNHGRTEASFLGRFFPKGAVGVACYRHDPEKPSSFFLIYLFFVGRSRPAFAMKLVETPNFLALSARRPPSRVSKAYTAYLRIMELVFHLY